MSSLKQQHETRQQLSALCGEAVQLQITRGDTAPTQLRQRRRHLLKALRKRLPSKALRTPEKLLHSAVMVLALWGFAGLAIPNTAQAAATFEHVMLEGFSVGRNSVPTFVDIDNDGDLDAFVGEVYGTVKFYQNDGTTSVPNFVATGSYSNATGGNVINPLAGFGVGNWAAPTFADIDNDGDLDLFVGESPGTVRFYRNDDTGTGPVFTADGAGNPLAGFDVGLRATPTFADIDNDGDLDAFVGESGGTVKFYQNDGSATTPSFVVADGTYVINPLSAVAVGSHATPTFADIDNDGDLDLFMGERYGTVKFYQNDGSAASPSFVAADGTYVTNPLAGFDVGFYAAPTFADIDNDGDLDAFVGEISGTVRFYRNDVSVTAPSFVATNGGTTINPLAGFDVGNYVAPAFADIDNDGDLDAFVGENGGTVKFYQNDGSAVSPSFVATDGTYVINPLAGFDVGVYATPTFADIDNDGDLDLFVGISGSTVKFYQNDGSATSPSFVATDGTYVINPLAGFVVGSAPTFADIDNDGDLDLFAGENSGTVKFYRNTGTVSAPNFAAADGTTIINPLAGVNVGSYAAPAFADLDHDGDLDAFVGEGNGTVKFYQNDGSATVPSFVAADGVTVINPLAGFKVASEAKPAFADIDNDGDMDLFVGEANGTVRFFENLEFTPATNTGGGGGGGAPGLPLLATLAALLPWRRSRRLLN